MYKYELIKELQSKNYLLKESDEMLVGIGKIKIIRAEKGKILKKRMLIFICELLKENDIEELCKFVKEKNNNKELCLVLCNTKTNPLGKTMFIDEYGDGAFIAHFVYYSLETKSFIYDLDFSYYQSKSIKEVIEFSIKRNEPFYFKNNDDIFLS